MPKKIQMSVHINQHISTIIEELKKTLAIEKDTEVITWSFSKTFNDLSNGKIIDWRNLTNLLNKTKSIKTIKTNEQYYTRTFHVSEEEYKSVKQNICSFLDLTKPQTSFVIRMILIYAYSVSVEKLENRFDEISLLDAVTKCFIAAKENPSDPLIEIANNFINDVNSVYRNKN